MAFLKIIFFLLFLLLIGGFAYLAIIDVPIEQKETTTTIAAEKFR